MDGFAIRKGLLFLLHSISIARTVKFWSGIKAWATKLSPLERGRGSGVISGGSDFYVGNGGDLEAGYVLQKILQLALRRCVRLQHWILCAMHGGGFIRFLDTRILAEEIFYVEFGRSFGLGNNAWAAVYAAACLKTFLFVGC